MAVWRKQTVRYRLGKRNVPKGTPKAKRETVESKRFYGTLTLRDGKRKQKPLTEDRDTSETLLRRLQCDEDAKRASGVTRYDDERHRPLGEHLAAYLDYLTTKGNTPLHVQTQGSRIRKLLAGTQAKTLADLDAGRILATLAIWRKRKRKAIGVASSNHYAVAIKGFSRWLWTERKATDDPLAGLRKLNAETDRRRVRRPLTPTELETLTTKTAASGKTYRGNDWQLTATDRAMLYAVAAYTGMRASECASLTLASFDFQAMTWTLPATATKNRKATTLPLSPTLAVKLQAWFATLKRQALFPGSWAIRKRGGKVLKRDLKRAGIAHTDDAGRVLDFHALRHTFITSLAKAGVHPAKAQRLARHSTITLTMGVYTTLDCDDLREAIGALDIPMKKNAAS